MYVIYDQVIRLNWSVINEVLIVTVEHCVIIAVLFLSF